MGVALSPEQELVIQELVAEYQPAYPRDLDHDIRSLLNDYGVPATAETFLSRELASPADGPFPVESIETDA